MIKTSPTLRRVEMLATKMLPGGGWAEKGKTYPVDAAVADLWIATGAAVAAPKPDAARPAKK